MLNKYLKRYWAIASQGNDQHTSRSQLQCSYIYDHHRAITRRNVNAAVDMNDGAIDRCHS